MTYEQVLEHVKQLSPIEQNKLRQWLINPVRETKSAISERERIRQRMLAAGTPVTDIEFEIPAVFQELSDENLLALTKDLPTTKTALDFINEDREER